MKEATIISLIVMFMACILWSNHVRAQNHVIKCEPDRKGAVCCWDTAQYGPSRPWICD